MKRELPETPVFDSLVEKYGSLSVFDMYFDDNMDPLPDAPKELIDETKKIREFNSGYSPKYRYV